VDVSTPVVEVAASPDSPPPRRRRRWVLATSITLLVVLFVVAIVLVVVDANRTFDAAARGLRAANDRETSATGSLRERAEETSGSATSAEEIVTLAADDLVDVGARTAVSDAAAASVMVVGEADSLLASDAEPQVPPKAIWPWELQAAAERMRADAEALGERTSDAVALEESLADSDAALVGAARAMYASVAPAAAALESANVSAVALVVLDFRDAAEAAVGQDALGSGALTAFTTYAALATNLEQSAQSELDEKSGVLFATRLEIEEYARSIAGGVVLDFDWAPLVNGLGGAWGLSGTATWNTARGGFSTITLSDSIAETWPSADSRAIVTHEVGHSITSKCSLMFDSQNGPANEEWATAWAIGMGQTAEGNGVQAYGYPSQAMIDAAYRCR
jgi:hypothetical protein